MNETNEEVSPLAPESLAPESASEASASEVPKAPGFFADPVAQKMMIYLIVLINAALVVVGSLLPWLDENKISEVNSLWWTVVGDLVPGYGAPTFAFGAALLAALIVKKDNFCLHLYLASAAFWAMLSFVLGPNKEEEVGVWLALSGSAVIVFVLLTHQLGEWMSEIKAGGGKAQDEAGEETDKAENSTAINRRTANAALAGLAGVGALLSTLLWDWIRFPSDAPQRFLDIFEINRSISAFDKPLRMTFIIFVWSIVVIVGSIIVLQERSYKKPMPNLFKAIRVSWVLAGIAICVVSGGLMLPGVFWEGGAGALLEAPVVAFVSGILLLVASRSEWKSDCSA